MIPALTRLYVVTHRYDLAKGFADLKGVPVISVRFIDSRKKIMGLQGIKLHVLQTAQKLACYDELLQEARLRGFEVEYV